MHCLNDKKLKTKQQQNSSAAVQNLKYRINLLRQKENNLHPGSQFTLGYLAPMHKSES